eukprot:255100-Alexandrium_andersonii.AAC.1
MLSGAWCLQHLHRRWYGALVAAIPEVQCPHSDGRDDVAPPVADPIPNPHHASDMSFEDVEDGEFNVCDAGSPGLG